MLKRLKLQIINLIKMQSNCIEKIFYNNYFTATTNKIILIFKYYVLNIKNI